MIIPHEKVIAFRCPECGNVTYKKIDMFSLTPGREQILKCNCSESCISIKRTGEKYMIDAFCVSCVEHHKYYIDKAAFVGQKLISYRCPVTGFGVFCVGNRQQVEDEQDSFDEEMFMMLGDYMDEFEDFDDEDDREIGELVFKGLDHLYNLLNRGLISCKCGGEVKFDVYGDGVCIYCDSCQNQMELPIFSEEDLNLIKEIESIVLE